MTARLSAAELIDFAAAAKRVGVDAERLRGGVGVAGGAGGGAAGGEEQLPQVVAEATGVLDDVG